MEVIKVYDKADGFDIKVQKSREFLDEWFGKRPIKLIKMYNGEEYEYTLIKDEWESVLVAEDGYFHNLEEVLLEYGTIAQYQ